MRAFVQKRTPRYMEQRERAASGGSSEFVWGPPAAQCPGCGADGLPAAFDFCGSCGTALYRDGRVNGSAGVGVSAETPVGP
jgi:hypothetical protein